MKKQTLPPFTMGLSPSPTQVRTKRGRKSPDLDKKLTFKSAIDSMLMSRQGKGFKSQPRNGKSIKLNQNSQFHLNRTNYDDRFSTVSVNQDSHNTIEQTMRANFVTKDRNSTSRKALLDKIRIRAPLDPLEADYAVRICLPQRVNRID